MHATAGQLLQLLLLLAVWASTDTVREVNGLQNRSICESLSPTACMLAVHAYRTSLDVVASQRQVFLVSKRDDSGDIERDRVDTASVDQDSKQNNHWPLCRADQLKWKRAVFIIDVIMRGSRAFADKQACAQPYNVLHHRSFVGLRVYGVLSPSVFFYL